MIRDRPPGLFKPTLHICLQIRGCLSCEFGVVTASRDKTIKIWVEESANTYTQLSTLVSAWSYMHACVRL